MERWAANTLRTLARIFISGFVLLASAFLLLCSLCAYGGGLSGIKHPEQGPWFIAAAVVVIALGVWANAVIGRRIVRAINGVEASSALPDAGLRPTDRVLHLSPLGRRAIMTVVIALCVRLALAVAGQLLNLTIFWKSPAGVRFHASAVAVLASSALYQIPYLILIVALLRRPDRRAFAYSIAVPAVLILQGSFGSSLLGYFFIRHPAGIVLLAVPLIMDIVILVLAYKAIQQVGLHPQPSSLVVAAIATFVYFSFIQGLTPVLYRFW